MILQNSFYTLSSMTGDSTQINAIIHINPEHNIFQGHFPGQPVVPGVCMVQIVKELAEQATGRKLLLRQGHQIKFLQLLVPEATTAIQVAVKLTSIAENDIAVTAAFQKGEENIFKLSGNFTDRK